MAEAAKKDVNQKRVQALKIAREMSRKKTTRVKDIIARMMSELSITKPNAEYYYRRVFLVQKEKAAAKSAEPTEGAAAEEQAAAGKVKPKRVRASRAKSKGAINVEPVETESEPAGDESAENGQSE